MNATRVLAFCILVAALAGIVWDWTLLGVGPLGAIAVLAGALLGNELRKGWFAGA